MPAYYQSPLLYLYAHKPPRMSTNSFITTALLLLALQGCKSKKASDSHTNASNGNYIVLPDTTAFDPSWSKENVVVVHTISEPDNLHPTNGTTAIRAEIQMYTQMSLLQTDMRVPGVRPALCKDIPIASGDGLTFSFELRRSPDGMTEVPFPWKTSSSRLRQINARRCKMPLQSLIGLM